MNHEISKLWATAPSGPNGGLSGGLCSAKLELCLETKTKIEFFVNNKSDGVLHPLRVYSESYIIPHSGSSLTIESLEPADALTTVRWLWSAWRRRFLPRDYAARCACTRLYKISQKSARASYRWILNLELPAARWKAPGFACVQIWSSLVVLAKTSWMMFPKSARGSSLTKKARMGPQGKLS